MVVSTFCPSTWGNDPIFSEHIFNKRVGSTTNQSSHSRSSTTSHLAGTCDRRSLAEEIWFHQKFFRGNVLNVFRWFLICLFHHFASFLQHLSTFIHFFISTSNISFPCLFGRFHWSLVIVWLLKKTGEELEQGQGPTTHGNPINPSDYDQTLCKRAGFEPSSWVPYMVPL